MKNPFDHSVSAEDIRFVPYMMRTFGHAKYAAHAINQHDKLVAGLELAIEWLDEVCNPANEELFTPEGLEVRGELAALLKEETT